MENVTDGVFYLGRGSDGIKVGDVFQVMQQGAPILDRDTHETIGYTEKELARVVVTEVLAKLSKATVESGEPIQLADSSNLIVRRVAPSLVLENNTSNKVEPAIGAAPKSAIAKAQAPVAATGAQEQRQSPVESPVQEGKDF